MYTETWVARYRWPETYRFKHVPKGHGFMLYGRPYVRISARRYVPAEVHFIGYSAKNGPVKHVQSVNIPVAHIVQ